MVAPSPVLMALLLFGKIEILNVNTSMGRGQIIWRLEDGTLCGGTEPRADGSIAVW